MTLKPNLTSLLLILVACVELFLYLNRGALIYDEAIYAQVAKEIVQRNEWLTLHWNGLPWFEKPPLYMWATALLFKLFGVGEFWARAISAACGVGVVATSMRIANLLYGRAAEYLTAIILLSSPLFVVYARFGTIDICLTFFVMLAFYAFLQTTRNSRFWIVAWLSCAFAVMAKGAAGLAVVLILALGFLIEGQLRRALTERFFWIGLTLAFVIVAVWHAGMYAMHRDNFLRNYLVRHVLERSTSDLNARNFGYGFYVSALLRFFFPWAYLLPFAVVFEARRRRPLVLVIFSTLVVLIYTAVTTKFQWYILPAIPGFSIVIGGFLAGVLPKLRPVVRQLVYVAVGGLFIAGLARSVVYSLPGREMESASRLARSASADPGPITTYPNDLEMTVLFYSGRRLCAHPRPVALAHSGNAKCDEVLPRNIIFRTSDLSRIESFYEVVIKSVDGDLRYAEVLGAR